MASGGRPPATAAHVVNRYTFAPLSSCIMLASCKLKIFDVLKEDGPEMSANEVAEKIGASVAGTERLMRACAQLDLLVTRTSLEGKVLFANTEETDMYLRNSGEMSLLPMIDFFLGPTFEKLQKLDETVTSGKPVINHADAYFSMPSEQEQKLALSFDNMATVKCFPLKDLPLAFDFSKFKKCIDCGGGTGMHALHMKQAYPNMDVRVLETQDFYRKREILGIKLDTEKINYIEGNFFEKLPEADLFLLSHIMHAWNEEKCDLILRNVHHALPSGGGVILYEKLYGEDRSLPLAAVYDMIMLSHGYGRERTKSEYVQLLQKHGFGDVNFKVIEGAIKDVVFAIKM